MRVYSFILYLFLFTIAVVSCHKEVPLYSEIIQPVDIPVSNDIGYLSQGATIVGDKLWVACDDYQGTTEFKVINIENGLLERTIHHNLSHCNSVDYNEEIDAIVLPYDVGNEHYIIIYNNISFVKTEMTLDEAIVIPFEDMANSICWGEDNKTLYQVQMWDDLEKRNKFLIRKILLGETERGVFNGTYKIEKTYQGIIYDDIDTYHTSKGINYAQDCDFASELILAYGTNGHNFLTISLDDNNDRFSIRNNLVWKFFDEKNREYFLEPEFVTLYNNDKVILGSRNYHKRKSAVLMATIPTMPF